MVKDNEYLLPRYVSNRHIMAREVRKRLTDARIMTFDSKDWKGVRDADSRGVVGKTIRGSLGLNKAHKEERHEESRLRPLVDALFKIPGVVSVTIKQYSVSIKKGEIFTWDEIRPQAEKILKKHLAK
ncbi:MAG: NifU N-terminal domain-containing protein [Patescibacteria group bacterium]